MCKRREKWLQGREREFKLEEKPRRKKKKQQRKQAGILDWAYTGHPDEEIEIKEIIRILELA